MLEIVENARHLGLEKQKVCNVFYMLSFFKLFFITNLIVNRQFTEFQLINGLEKRIFKVTWP